MTTAASVQASVGQLARDRTRLLVQSRGFGASVTDDMDPLAAPSQAHGFVQAGSVAVGLRGRWNLGGGVTILGGLGWGEAAYAGVRGDDSHTGSLAIRYAPGGPSRPFVEAGGLLGHTADVTLTRTYLNGAGVAFGVGSTSANTTALWGRAGWIWDLGEADQVGAYAEYGLLRQSLAPYVEPLSQANPFEAHVQGGSDSLGVGKLGLRVNDAVPGGWELGSGLALAHAFTDRQRLNVSVPGFGAVAAGPPGRVTWLEYGARVGHSLTRHSTLSLFAAGVVGTGAVGGHIHAGVDYRVTF